MTRPNMDQRRIFTAHALQGCATCPAYLPQGHDGTPDCIASGNCLAVYEEVRMGPDAFADGAYKVISHGVRT